MEKNEIVECYCCQKEYKLGEITKISATTSGKCQDKTRAEDRFVCNNCNNLKEYAPDKNTKLLLHMENKNAQKKVD